MNFLRKGLEEYITCRTKLGFKLKNDQILLSKFLSFIEKNGEDHITSKLALAFAKITPTATPATWSKRLGIIRQFATYWSTKDPKTEIPSSQLLSVSYKRKSPHIYSDQEIFNILQSCLKLSKPEFERNTYFILFGLLAVTGARINELLSLESDCVNLDNGIIIIRESKFGKSRYLPLHKSTVDILKAYVKYQNKYLLNKNASYFFVNSFNLKIEYASINNVFQTLLKKLNLKKKKGLRNPRIMDFRHTFAVKTIIRWYKKGFNVDQYIPLLSTYLGHVHPTNTYWYLSTTPELLELVSARIEKVGEKYE